MSKTRTPPAHTLNCARCPATWPAWRWHHCPLCCRTFTSARAQNTHAARDADGRATCVPPGTVGLVAVTSPYGTAWTLGDAPGPHPTPTNGRA